MSKAIPMKETAGDKAVRRAAMENSGRRLLDLILSIEVKDDVAAHIADERKQKFAEAKADGYDGKALRKVLKLRRESGAQAAARGELDLVVETYLTAIEEANEA
jgi:uncharacterized protein (UPF0335 family)